MNKKDIAKSFFELAFSGKVQEAWDKYVHPDFRHHNPKVKEGAEALKQALEDFARIFPNNQYEVKRVLEDGDFVVVHVGGRMKPEDEEESGIYIFRFDGDLIAEEWEVFWSIPDDSPNKDGAF
jgi:predicted SnoaL-like aldol condensation-catalyzing enzyme